MFLRQTPMVVAIPFVTDCDGTERGALVKVLLPVSGDAPDGAAK